MSKLTTKQFLSGLSLVIILIGLALNYFAKSVVGTILIINMPLLTIANGIFIIGILLLGVTLITIYWRD